jgi:hypothetical protein
MPKNRVNAAHPFTLPSGRPVAFGDTVTLETKDAASLVDRGRLAPEATKSRQTTTTTPAQADAADASQEASS